MEHSLLRDHGATPSESWNAAAGLQVGEYTGHSDRVNCVAFSADGLHIASACNRCEIHVWTTGAMPLTVPQWCSNHLEKCWGWHCSCLVGWQLRNPVIAFTMAQEVKLAVSSTMAGDLTVWDTHTWTERRRIEHIQPWSPTFRTTVPYSDLQGLLSFSPDSAHLVIATPSCCEVLDAWTWTRIRQFQGHTGKVVVVQFSLDGSLPTSASEGKTIHL